MTFSGNHSGDNRYSSKGGALYSTGGTPMLTNCTFLNNKCGNSFGDSYYGGAIYIYDGALTNCTFSGNRCTSNDNCLGGAAYISGSTLANCTFLDNHCGEGEWASYGGAISMSNSTLSNCIFMGNKCYSAMEGGRGGAISMSSSSLTNCTFISNLSDGTGGIGSRGGAIVMSSSKVSNCTFIDNKCSSSKSIAFGGAILMNNGTITNCTFSFNHCSSGSSQDTGGAISLSGNSVLTNCIFWGDSAKTNPEIHGNASIIKNCVIQGGYSGSGTVESIFTGDPLLGSLGNNGGPVQTIPIDPAGSAFNNGTTAVPSGVDISTDARGFPRSDGKPDIGAFEVQ